MAEIVAIISANTMPGQKRLESTRPDIFILKIDGDPTVGDGIVAPIGSFATIELTSEVYLKLGTENTNWRKIADQNGIVSSATTSTVTSINDDMALVSVEDTIILSNPTISSSVSIILPSGEDHLSKRISIKDSKGIASLYNITVFPDGTETIDHQSELVIDENFASITLIYAEGNWNIF